MSYQSFVNYHNKKRDEQYSSGKALNGDGFSVTTYNNIGYRILIPEPDAIDCVFMIIMIQRALANLTSPIPNNMDMPSFCKDFAEYCSCKSDCLNGDCNGKD